MLNLVGSDVCVCDGVSHIIIFG